MSCNILLSKVVLLQVYGFNLFSSMNKSNHEFILYFMLFFFKVNWNLHLAASKSISFPILHSPFWSKTKTRD